MCWCRASLLAVAGSRRAALPGVGGILALPFCREVVNDPSWLICGTDSLGVALVSPPFPSPDSGASRRFTWRLATLPGALRHKLSPLFPSFLLPRALLCHLPEVNNETMCLLSGNLGFQVLLLLGGPGQLSINVFHNKTCIRSAMESVIEIAGGAPRGLGRSLLGGDLALGIGSIPLVETVKPILINIWSSPVLPVCMADFGS